MRLQAAALEAAANAIVITDPGGVIVWANPAFTTLTGLPSPAETADLELPEQTPAEPHRPTFADHAIARQPWPSRPERAAWPEVSGVSRPVLPPASPAPPSERPADPPR